MPFLYISINYFLSILKKKKKKLTTPSFPFPSCKLAWNLNPLPRIQAPWAGNSETKTGEECKRQRSGPSSENRNRCPRVQPCPAIKTAAYAAPLTRLIMVLLGRTPIKKTHTLIYRRKRVPAMRASASPSGLKETSQNPNKRINCSCAHGLGAHRWVSVALCIPNMKQTGKKATFRIKK